MSKARDIASAAPAPSTVSVTEIGYLDGVTSAIQTQLDAKTAKSTLTTTGDIYYASAANTPARLGIGTAGQVLTVASGVPSWAAGGKVLQVVQATYSTATSNSTTTYADTGLSLSITPSSASSKVLVLTMTPARKAIGNSDNGLWIRIVRGATSVLESGYALFTGADNALFGVVSQHYLDSPSTTSATTYKTQFKNNTAAASVDVQFNAQTSTIILMEIGA
jgi:hypothetical protein